MSPRYSRPTSFFRGQEGARLVSLLITLLVLGMLMVKARDPGMWRWLLSDTQHDDPMRAVAEGVALTDKVVSPEVETPENPDSEGIADQDAEEQGHAKTEFSLIEDHSPLHVEEMFAYWRLMRWALSQPMDTLQRRSRKDLLFTDFLERPDKLRGALVHLRLHVKRIRELDDLPSNELGLKHLYEVFGSSDDAPKYVFLLVLPEIPPGIPMGSDVSEEASFDGYFFKLWAYEAHDKKRFAPMLIGRAVWYPNTAALAKRDRDTVSPWTLAAAGGVGLLILAAIVLRWTPLFGTRPGGRRTAAEEKKLSQQTWFDEEPVDRGSTDMAETTLAEPTSNGTGRNEVFPHRFDE